MKRPRKLNPLSQEGHEAKMEFLRKMTPEELREFLFYRTPGVPETDMTGMYSDSIPKPAESQPQRAPRPKRAAKTA